MKITDSQKDVLIVLFCIALIFGTYRYYYVPTNEKIDKLKLENKNLEEEIKIYENMKMDLPLVQKNIKTIKKDTKKILKKYPNIDTQAKTILDGKDIALENNVKLISLAFSDQELLYTSKEQEQVPVEQDLSVYGKFAMDAAKDKYQSDDAKQAEQLLNENQPTQSDNNQEVDVSGAVLNGYVRTITVSIEGTYDNIKNYIRDVNDANKGTNLKIENFSASYISDKKDLMSSQIVYKQYIKNYKDMFDKEVEVDTVILGKDNIFK